MSVDFAKAQMVMVVLVAFSGCAATPDKNREQFSETFYILSTPKAPKTAVGEINLGANGQAFVKGVMFRDLNESCPTIYWGLEDRPGIVSLGCSNLNIELAFSNNNTLTIGSDRETGQDFLFEKHSSEERSQPSPAAVKTSPPDDQSAQSAADLKLYAPVESMSKQRGRAYIQKHRLLDRLKTDSFRELALGTIKAAEAEDAENRRRTKVGGISTSGRLGGGFHGYPWGTPMKIIREKHASLITHDEGNTIKIEKDGLLYRFYFYEDFLASVEIVPPDMEEHVKIFEQLRRQYGKPKVVRAHDDKSSNRRGDSFRWKRHELSWDDGVTEISLQHCETIYDPLNAGCFINPEFKAVISYDNKKLTKRLMEKLEREKRANAPF